MTEVWVRCRYHGGRGGHAFSIASTYYDLPDYDVLRKYLLSNLQVYNSSSIHHSQLLRNAKGSPLCIISITH